MAGLSYDAGTGTARIHFRYGGRKFHKSLKTTDQKEAEALKGRIELTLLDLERGRLTLPPGADFWTFVISDGRLDKKPELPKLMSLSDLFDWHLGQQTPDAKGEKTLSTEHVHKNHFLRILGARKPIPVSTGDLQEYINRRAKEEWFGKPIRPETIAKEIKTFQMVWNRAARLGMVKGEAPTAGLVYPKKKEKPPFQTWGEIERNLARGGLTEDEIREQWDSLFLQLEEVEEFLEFVRTRQTRSAYIYPLMVFAAHTGARLSEIRRSRVEDFKFDGGEVVIREMKKNQAKTTYRRVPMSSLLAETMQNYFQTAHPGGVYSICREADEPMLESTLHEAFDWFFRGSKWAVLKGYHVLRHSFASNLARKGEDQRVIDELMGHQTEAMRKRYRHLFPEQRVNAVKTLFG